MDNTAHIRKLKVKLKLLQAELKLREKNRNASLKGYERVMKMIEELTARIEKCETKQERR